MSSEFTPNKLIDNLNKYFKEIVGEALVGYYKVWKMDLDNIKMIRQNNLQLLNDEDMSSLLTVANINQYGKSYFANEVIINLTNMKLINIYLMLVKPKQFKDEDSTEPKIVELMEGQKGGLPYLKQFLVLAAGLIINSLTNATNAANAVATIGDTYMVDVPIGIRYPGGDTDIPPQVPPPFVGELDPNIPEQKEAYSSEFGRYPFPNDTTVELNIDDMFKQGFVDKMMSDAKFFNYFKMKLLSSNSLNKEFTSVVKQRTRELNIEMRSIYTSLEEMCEEFIKTKDPVLPIRAWELFNDSLIKDNALEKIRSREQELVEEKRKSLITEQFLEAGISEVITEDTSFISGAFNWIKSKPSTTKSLDNGLSLEKLEELRKKNEESANKQIQELGPEFKKQATQLVLNEQIRQFSSEIATSTDSTNLEVYYSSVCKINQSYYVYNETTGMLSLKNPARSRFHLKILVKNVMHNYKRVIEGLSKVDEGTREVITDVPNRERLENLKSLHEKAQAILPILTNYDRNIVSHLAEGQVFASDVNEFFKVITEMWVEIKSSMIQATTHLPITTEKEKVELSRNKEAVDRYIQKMETEHELETRQRAIEIKQQNEDNELSKEDWDTWGDSLEINLEGAVKKPIDAITKTVIHTVGGITVSAIDEAGYVLETGITNIQTTVWGLTISGMMCMFQLLLFSCWYSGLPGAVFKRIARYIEGTAPADAALPALPEPTSEQTYGVRRPTFGSIAQQEPAPVFRQAFPSRQSEHNQNDNNNSLTGTRLRPADVDVDDIQNMMSLLKINGGRRYNRKRLNHKTRKNKKRRTKKLKYGKRRQTKHKRMRSTRRH